jgi:uncharacterized protein YcfJ
MNTSMLVGITTAVVMVTTAALLVSYENRQHQKYADVISAKLVTTTVEGPRQQCYEETVTRPQPAEAQPNAAAALIGAVVERAFGRKSGKSRMSAAAATGQPFQQRDATYSTTQQQRCETVYDAEQQPAGYDVRYHYSGKSGTVHMDHDPGRRIPVENGELVLNDEDGGSDSFATNS